MSRARPADLEGWLAYLETLHPRAIAMGLARVGEVLARMGIALDGPVVTVAGTNGKGSTVAMIEAMLRCAGYRTGRYMSPHLSRYNERVAIDGVPVDDATLVEAFHAVEDARVAVDPPTPLTYFEFGTLAAFAVFARAKLDAVVLEVGLGGRLDAVNVIDPHVAVLTSVDLDHQDYLGPTREHIGREKAHVFRAGRAAVCGDPDPPASVIEHARAIGAHLCRIGIDYGAVAEGTQWRYFGPGGPRYGLPMPALRGGYQLGNAATAIAALAFLRDVLAGARRGRPRRAGAGRTAWTLPGPAGTTDDRARRGAQPACRTRVRRGAGQHGLSPADHGGVRDARGQGHRWRDRGGRVAHRPLARRDAAGTARCLRRRIAGASRGCRRGRTGDSRVPRRCDGVPRRGR